MKIFKLVKNKVQDSKYVEFNELRPRVYSDYNDESGIGDLNSQVNKLEDLIMFIAEKTNNKEIWKEFARLASDWDNEYEIQD
jgi:hypothetical protein